MLHGLDIWLSPHLGWTVATTSVIGQLPPGPILITESTCSHSKLDHWVIPTEIIRDQLVSLPLYTIKRHWSMHGRNLSILLSKSRNQYDPFRFATPRSIFIRSAGYNYRPPLKAKVKLMCWVCMIWERSCHNSGESILLVLLVTVYSWSLLSPLSSTYPGHEWR